MISHAAVIQNDARNFCVSYLFVLLLYFCVGVGLMVQFVPPTSSYTDGRTMHLVSDKYVVVYALLSTVFVAVGLSLLFNWMHSYMERISPWTMPRRVAENLCTRFFAFFLLYCVAGVAMLIYTAPRHGVDKKGYFLMLDSQTYVAAHALAAAAFTIFCVYLITVEVRRY